MISIIIIVKNDRRIEKTLKKIRALKEPDPYEVIVVDASAGALDDIRQKYDFAKWIPYTATDKSRTYAQQRNIGIRAAKGSIIIFIDADCVPDDHWLKELIKPIQKEQEQFISGAVRPLEKNSAHIEESHPKYRDECETMNMAVTSNLVHDVGFFDESMEGCEDSDFCIRARAKGYKIRFEKKAVVYHDWGGFLQNMRRSWNGGKDRASLYRKHHHILLKFSINNIYTFYYIAFILFLPIAFLFPPYLLILFLPSLIKRRNPTKELFNLAFSAGLITKSLMYVVASGDKEMQDMNDQSRSLVIYVFNNVFPDNAGFGKRCRKEIELLGAHTDLVVVCKKSPGQPKEEIISLGKRDVCIFRFESFADSQHIEEYEKKKGWYEIFRTVGLFVGLVSVLCAVLWKYRTRKKQLYTIVSPLTVPFVAYWIGLWGGARHQVVEFHDLEPELAQHIKKLSPDSLIMKIEYALERFVCRRFRHVVVTTHAQAQKIQDRTGINPDKIKVIPNSIQVEESLLSANSSPKKSGGLLVGYVSSFTFGYAVDTFDELQRAMASRHDMKGMQFMVVGGGPLLAQMQRQSEKLGISKQITYTGTRADVASLIGEFDVALVPWGKDAMTQTMAPTKLFEYMCAGKAVIAPDFGEFRTILTHGQNALLYTNVADLCHCIVKLGQDAKLRKNLSEQARHMFISHFKAERYKDIFSELIR